MTDNIHDLKLIHYSHAPIEELRDPALALPTSSPGHKPSGLWVSVENFGDTWAEWCTSTNFGLRSLHCPHRVTLADNADLLWLKGERAIDAFTMQFGTGTFGIRWDDLREKCQGIIIAPYIPSRRFTILTSWYLPWDCASGCIWNKDAIKKIECLQPLQSA